MIKCIIIEDQEPAQRILKRYLSDTSDVTLIGTFGNALVALDFLKLNTVDLIFLDIHLPKLSGMDFMAVLSTKPQIILTTAFSEYALKSYEFDVTDYLLKPFSFERFIKAVYKVKNQLNILQTEANSINKESNDSILLKVGYDFVKIDINSILFIKSDGDYTNVFSKEQKFMVSHSLIYWQGQLPKDTFYQIHRSYIINVRKIQKHTASKVFINHTALPIGRVFKKDFFDFFSNL